MKCKYRLRVGQDRPLQIIINLTKEGKNFGKRKTNAKTKNKKGISSVTFWGLHDGVTWLNVPSNGQLRWLNNVHQYPLIFDENLNTKPAFYGVLEAANEAE